MTDRVNEIGAVHGVEMEIGDATVEETEHLLCRNRCRDETARGGIVVETLEAIGEPLRYACAGAPSEVGGLLEILHGHDAGHDRDRHAAIARAIKKTQIALVLEKELRDGAGGTGINLRFQHIEVEIERR